MTAHIHGRFDQGLFWYQIWSGLAAGNSEIHQRPKYFFLDKWFGL